MPIPAHPHTNLQYHNPHFLQSYLRFRDQALPLCFALAALFVTGWAEAGSRRHAGDGVLMTNSVVATVAGGRRMMEATAW